MANPPPQQFEPDSRVSFYPLTRQIEGPEAVIGRPETHVFVALPLEALEVIDGLTEGLTVRETGERFFERHGETVDVGDLLAALDSKGFLERPPDETAGREAPPEIQFHFSGLSESLAKKVFSLPSLLLAGALVVSAVLVACFEPSLRPSWDFLFFRENVTLMTLALMTAGLFVTAFHEMGHLTAARARGVSCRLAISNRLWMLVAETNMTGVWGLPRRKRFLPILAGPLVDSVSGSIVILTLFASLRGWIDLHPQLLRFLQAMVLVYLLGLAWQLYFFVRTDLYFLYTTLFRCKNLMGDTKDLLKNLWARLRRRPEKVDQSHIPRSEMKAIRVYSVFWLAGRGVAFWVLFTISLPLMAHYFIQTGSRLLSIGDSGLYNFLDAVLFSTISMAFGGTGLWMWLRSMRRSRR